MMMLHWKEGNEAFETIHSGKQQCKNPIYNSWQMNKYEVSEKVRHLRELGNDTKANQNVLNKNKLGSSTANSRCELQDVCVPIPSAPRTKSPDHSPRWWRLMVENSRHGSFMLISLEETPKGINKVVCLSVFVLLSLWLTIGQETKQSGHYSTLLPYYWHFYEPTEIPPQISPLVWRLSLLYILYPCGTILFCVFVCLCNYNS